MPYSNKSHKQFKFHTIMTMFSANKAVLTLYAAILLIITGCSSNSNSSNNSTNLPQNEPTIDIIINDGSQTQINADPKRLPGDIEWAVEKTHWATINRSVFTQNQSLQKTASQNNLPITAQQAQTLYRLKALLPDGRSATILGWKQSESAVCIAIKVGHFSDSEKEILYLKQLAKLLAGKPKPLRDTDFELPVWEPIKQQLQKQIDNITTEIE